MLGLDKLVAALKGMSWVLRPGGLCASIERLQAQVNQLEEQLALLRDQARESEEALHCILGKWDTHYWPQVYWSLPVLCQGIRKDQCQVQGHTMFLDPADVWIGNSLAFFGIWEPSETHLIRKELGRGSVAVDVGANIGYFALLMARAVGPEGRVYAFEPDPTNFAFLQKNIAANGYGNVSLLQKAVARRSGVARLFLHGQNKGAHTLYEPDDELATIEVETVRLDELLCNEAAVDLIKMDIEGAEGDALFGMLDLLRRTPRLKILTEFWPRGLERSGVDPGIFLGTLEEGGFTLYEVVQREAWEPVPLSADPQTLLQRQDPNELLETHTPENGTYTNLWCVKES